MFGIQRFAAQNLYRHITYVFRENSLCNRRFEQRKKLKELLGKKHRSLVTLAKRCTQSSFVDELTAQQAFIIRKGLKMGPDQFWRLATGSAFMELPDAMAHVSDVLLCQIPSKKRQLDLFSDEYEGCS